MCVMIRVLSTSHGITASKNMGKRPVGKGSQSGCVRTWSATWRCDAATSASWGLRPCCMMCAMATTAASPSYPAAAATNTLRSSPQSALCSSLWPAVPAEPPPDLWLLLTAGCCRPCALSHCFAAVTCAVEVLGTAAPRADVGVLRVPSPLTAGAPLGSRADAGPVRSCSALLPTSGCALLLCNLEWT